MNNYNLIVKQEADQEIIISYLWYESKYEGLGERFLHSLDYCFNTIDINTATYHKIYKEQRQAIVTKFPFVVLY